MDRSQELNKPFVSETTESARVLYLCMYCITDVIDLITVYITCILIDLHKNEGHLHYNTFFCFAVAVLDTEMQNLAGVSVKSG